MEPTQDGRTVVIVDDQVFFRGAMARLLRACGIEVEAFASGRDFIERLEASPAFEPACVVLDMQMPVMSGLDVQRWLVRERPAVPTIVVSAAPRARNREAALAAGATAYFEKPFDEELFLAAVHCLLLKTDPPPA